MNIAAIDVGGTTIKYGIFSENALTGKGSVPTPKTLEAFHQTLLNILSEMEESHPIQSVGVCLPGVVNTRTGFVEGISVLPYIHGFDIRSNLEEKLKKTVFIENDANCAALAELEFGVAKGMKEVVFLILGTGVGGVLVFGGKIQHGANLFSGEFGFLLMENNKTFAEVGTVIHLERRYQKRTGETLTGEEIFQRSFAKEPIASEEVEVFFNSVAQVIYNIQYAVDVSCIVLGGGVSGADFLIPELKKRLDQIMQRVKIAPIYPEIKVCQFKQDANLIGIASECIQKMEERVCGQ